MYKSELIVHLCPDGHRLVTASILAEQLAGFLVDEVQPRAGEADQRGIGIRLVLARNVRQPMLHVGAQPRAFEKDMSTHLRDMRRRSLAVTSVCLRSCGPRRVQPLVLTRFLRANR